jgi:hypothetical protein
MESIERALCEVKWSLVALLVLLACGVANAGTPTLSCQKDALGQWYCAADPKGVAVLDHLGKVMCSPGRCIEVGDEWQCSAVSGGGARRTPDGPVCEGGCRAPRAVDCERGPGPT